jgi:hypothetical protein
MPELTPTPGPHVIRRLTDPPADYLQPARTEPGLAAQEIAYCHNAALKKFGSDSGGFHAFDPAHRFTLGVFDGNGSFPPGSVVTSLAWGRITARLAQRVLELDALA